MADPKIPEMVERVARAIVRAGAASGASDPDDLEKVIEFSWPHHVHIASAAILAMREPTEAMVDAARPHIDWLETSESQIVGSFGAMIDAALEWNL